MLIRDGLYSSSFINARKMNEIKMALTNCRFCPYRMAAGTTIKTFNKESNNMVKTILIFAFLNESGSDATTFFKEKLKKGNCSFMGNF